jgi:hypothetical protein
VAKVTNPPTKRADEAHQKAPVPFSIDARITPSGTTKGPENSSPY